MRAWLQLFVLAIATCTSASCETPVRPMPPDAPSDAPLDVPVTPDVGACPLVEGYYLGSSTCPALDDTSFGACIAQRACALDLALATSPRAAMIELDGMFGTFADGALATDVTCAELVVEASRLRISCVDRIGIGCEVVLQPRSSDRSGLCCLDESACGEGERCTLVALSVGPPITTACVDGDGEGTAGMACTRGGSGEDDCAPGHYCTGLGASGDALACRTLCRRGADCGGGACVATGSAPAMGFCVEGCDPFDAGSCGAARACVPIPAYGEIGESALTGVCDDEGAGALGEACEADGCADGLVCARNALLELRCALPCDDTHPCDTGTCTPLADGEMLGTCQ